jgi:SAM-dependent methyltransferase
MPLPQECPLCGAGRTAQAVVTPHVYGDKTKTRAFFHCAQCDVRYQYPGLTPEEEERFYAAEFESFMAGRAGTSGGWSNVDAHVKANEPTRLRRMRYLAPLLPAKASVLEFGCSSGFMIQPLIAAGHECWGIEPSGVFRDALRRLDLRVDASLEEFRAANRQKRFDVVMHYFVLEHIAEPLPFLRSQLDLLVPSGKIVFEIPNAADPLYSVYDIPAFERFYWSTAHPWYFTERSLRHLLDQLGRPYEIKLDQRYDFSNHMVWARDGRPGGMGRFSAEIGADFEEIYKQTLIRAGKCDTLIGVITNS